MTLKKQLLRDLCGANLTYNKTRNFFKYTHLFAHGPEDLTESNIYAYNIVMKNDTPIAVQRLSLTKRTEMDQLKEAKVKKIHRANIQYLHFY